MSAPGRPAGLGYQGKKLWDSIAEDAADYNYRLRPDELATLEGACRLADMVDFLTKDWVKRGRPAMTVGSTGQEVIHPLIDKANDCRMKQATLLAKLKLPDGKAPGAATNQHRDAANSRWATTHGAGA